MVQNFEPSLLWGQEIGKTSGLVKINLVSPAHFALLVGLVEVKENIMHPLEQAALLIEQHLATLNVERSTCPCCEVARYEDFAQYQEHTELTAVVRKLRRFQHRDILK